MHAVETTAPQNVAPEPTLNAPVVAAEAPDVADPETVSDADQHAQPESDDKPEDEASKTLRRMERRIARLTAAKYEAEARAKQAAQEAESYRQRYAQPEEPQDQQPIRPEDVLTLADRIARERVERERTVSTIKSVLSSGREIEGFDDACNAVNEELPFYDQGGRPTPFLQVVLESEAPARVLHYLGSNPDVAAEFAGLSATQQARRIARIETQLSEPPALKVSKAPKPIAPLRGVSRDDGGLSDNIPIEEWARRFRERMSKR